MLAQERYFSFSGRDAQAPSDSIGVYSMGWKTCVGAVLAGLGVMFAGNFTVESITTGIGIILGGVGVRHAISKTK